jgi:hypothetical protein
MKFKTLALAAGLSVLATSAFADDAYTPTFDLSPAGLTAGALGGSDITVQGNITGVEGGSVNFTDALTGAAVQDNTALIMQDGTVHPNIAFIDQNSDAVAGANLALILQDGTNQSNNAAIYQLGGGNSAIILQH